MLILNLMYNKYSKFCRVKIFEFKQGFFSPEKYIYEFLSYLMLQSLLQDISELKLKDNNDTNKQYLLIHY